MDAPAVNPHRIEYLTSKARLLAGSKRLCGDIYAWAASAEDMLLDLADALQHLHSMVSQGQEEALLAQGWRRCAAGQRVSQWCAAAEGARAEADGLLRQALEALEGASQPANAEEPAGKVIAAIRSRLGLESCTPT
jgi:hypothetical protein